MATTTAFSSNNNKPPPPATATNSFFELREGAQRDKMLQIIGDLQSKMLYSEKYEDDDYEYRHVILPRDFIHLNLLPKGLLLSEEQWRMLGVRQSLGWEHYMVHAAEPNVLLFRRRLQAPQQPQQQQGATAAGAHQ